MRFGADWEAPDYEAQNTYYPAVPASNPGVPYYLSPNPAPAPAPAPSGGSWSMTATIDSQTQTSNPGLTDAHYVSTNPAPVGDNASGFFDSVKSSGGSIFDSIFGTGKQAVTGIVDIFGHQVQPTVNPQQPQSKTPLWVWIALPVAGVVVLGLTARALRSPKKRYAGHRRSRR